MLLYIDKKKQKRRRIKIAALTIAAVLFVILNCTHFSTALHQTDKTLLTYHPRPSMAGEYEHAAPVTLFTFTFTFTSAADTTPAVILIPAVANRQNFITTAQAFSQIVSDTTEVQFTPEIKETSALLSLIQIFAPACRIAESSPATVKQPDTVPLDTEPSVPHSIIVSSDINAVNAVISAQNLYPHTINYTTALKKLKTSKTFSLVKPLLDRLFPLPQKPQGRLAAEQNALRSFAFEHKKELLATLSLTAGLPTANSSVADSFVANSPVANTPAASASSAISPRFSTDNLLLQNAPLCLTAREKTACSLDLNASLEKNLKTALHRLSPGQTPLRLSLLTSAVEITPQTMLMPDEGLMFRFGSRENLLLPQEIAAFRKSLAARRRQPLPASADNAEIFRFLQLQSGLNPDYHNDQMKFYKFKTVEINLNDNI